MNNQLEIFLLGGLTIHLNGEPVSQVTSSKAKALFVYLAYRQRPFSRDALATLLYGDLPQKRAAANLRVLLSRLRPLGDYLDITRQSVAIHPDGNYWLDAHALEQQLAELSEPSSDNVAQWESTLALYRGDFLSGFHLRDALEFEEWVVVEQERLRQRVIQALGRLVTYYLNTKQYQAGIERAHQLLQLDPLQEETYRQLMLLLARSGQRSTALSQYRQCRQILADELGVDPSAKTTDLYERILALEQPGPADPRRVSVGAVNLPRQLTPFVGRAAELAQLTEQLAHPDCRLLTLGGVGGVGKTRLALQMMQQLAADDPAAFPDGLYFVPLTAVDQRKLIASTIAEALNFSFHGREKPETQLNDYLRHKKLLLVLDSFEHLLDGAALLVDMLQSAPDVKILVISRERLNLHGEWLFTVEGLDVPHHPNGPPEQFGAVQLFVQSARRVQPNFSLTPENGPPVIRICQLVGGMPLAIELAAAWLRILSCREVATEIERNLNFLTTSLQDIPERHRSLQAVFNHSWSLLLPEEQSVLCQLSVFRGQFTRAAAEQITEATLHTLAALVDKSWLTRHASNNQAPARYEMHNLLQRYAAEKLAQTTPLHQTTHHKHCRYYAAFLHQKTTDFQGAAQREALPAVGGEIENIRAAWNWAIDNNKITEIDQSLESLFHFYDMRSWFREGEEAFGRAIEALKAQVEQITADPQLPITNYQLPITNPQNPKSIKTYAKLLARQGWFAFHLGRHTEARDKLQRGLALLQQANAQADTVFCLNYVAAVFRHLGEYEPAKQALEESLSICQTTGDRFGASIALNILGQVASLQGDYAKAQQLCRQALAIKRELGDYWGITYSLTYLGRVAESLGNYAEAQQLLQESLAIYREIGDRRGTAFALQNLGSVSQALSANNKAKEQYQAALEIFEEIGNQLGAATCLMHLGQVSGALGDFQAAQAYLHQALQVTTTFQAWPKTLDILVELAELFAQFEQKERAFELLTLARRHLLAGQTNSKQLEPLITELKANLPAETVETIQARQQPKSLEAIVNEVLASKQ